MRKILSYSSFFIISAFICGLFSIGCRVQVNEATILDWSRYGQTDRLIGFIEKNKDNHEQVALVIIAVHGLKSTNSGTLYMIDLLNSDMNDSIKNAARRDLFNDRDLYIHFSDLLNDSRFRSLIDSSKEFRGRCIYELLDYCIPDNRFRNFGELLNIAVNFTGNQYSKEEIVLAFLLNKIYSAENGHLPKNADDITVFSTNFLKLYNNYPETLSKLSAFKEISDDLDKMESKMPKEHVFQRDTRSQAEKDKANDALIIAGREYNKYLTSLPPGGLTTKEEEKRMTLLKKAADAERATMEGSPTIEDLSENFYRGLRSSGIHLSTDPEVKAKRQEEKARRMKKKIFVPFRTMLISWTHNVDLSALGDNR